jgi:sodium-dependent dicarboxylate transporter 2/3/5
MAHPEPDVPHAEREDVPHPVRALGLAAGPMAAVAALLLCHPACGARGALSGDAAITLALLLWMAVWWTTAAVPLAATSLLPVLLLPVCGVGNFSANAAPYSDGIIFLFAGGAALGLALDRTRVSARFALAVLGLAGRSPVRIVAALFVSSALVSAWVSNTATAAMMLPVAVAATAWARANAAPHPARETALANFGVAALLAVAYGASTGGLLTLIGSPPNAIAADWLRGNGREIGFVGWLRFSVPVATVFGPLAVLALVRLNPMHGLVLRAAPRGDDIAASEAHRPAPLDRFGWATVAVFGLAATLWVLHPFIPALRGRVTDGGVAVVAALLLLAVPLQFRPWRAVLGASALRDLPWSVLILFGGGLSLADAMQRSGLSASLGEQFGALSALPTPLVVALVVAALVFASEVASNTALTATAVPILGALAPALGLPPEKLVIPAAFGASYAFMLPVGTPPNAIVYGTGLVPLPRMLRTGLVLNIVGTVTITLAALVLL